MTLIINFINIFFWKMYNKILKYIFFISYIVKTKKLFKTLL